MILPANNGEFGIGLRTTFEQEICSKAPTESMEVSMATRKFRDVAKKWPLGSSGGEAWVTEVRRPSVRLQDEELHVNRPIFRRSRSLQVFFQALRVRY